MAKPRKDKAGERPTRKPYGGHRKTCHRKIRHRTEYEAQNAIKRQRRRKNYDGQELKTYECSVCQGWHVGHAEKPEERANAARS